MLTPPSRGFYQTLLGKFCLQLLRELLLCLGLTGESIYDIGFTWDLIDDLDSRRRFHDDFLSTEGCFDAFDPLRVLF